MQNQKFIYQIGDPLFDGFVWLPSLEDTSFNISKNAKTRVSDNAFIDGFDDNFRFQESLLGGWELSMTLTRKEDTPWNYLQKMKRKKLKIFILERPVDNDSSKFKIYYFFGRYKSGLGDFYSSNGGAESGSSTTQLRSIDLVFDVEKPFYYQTDSDLKLLNHLASGDFLTWGDSSINYGDSSVDYGVTNADYEIQFNNLSKTAQREYLSDLCNPTYHFSFADKFIKNQPQPESLSINTNNSFTTTLTSNSVLNINSSDLDLNTSEKSYFNLIKLEMTGGFATDEWVEIINTDTNSGFIFTWKASYNSADNLLLNTAQISNRLVDLDVGNVVNPIDSAGNDVFDFNITDNEIEPLIFSNRIQVQGEGQKAISTNLPNSQNDRLQIQKNTTANLKITIKNLKTFS